MSHFTVLVIGDNPEKQLIPYQEEDNGNYPKEYLEFNNIEDEYRKDYEKKTRQEYYSESCSSNGMRVSIENYNKLKAKKIGLPIVLSISKIDVFRYFEKNCYYRCNTGDNSEDIWIYVIDIIETKHPDNDVCFEGKIRVRTADPPKEIPLKEYYSDFDDFIQNWAGYKYDEDEKAYGYWQNPNRKWDWYKLGGRWHGFFKIKNGSCDQAYKKNIDFDRMKIKRLEQFGSDYDYVYEQEHENYKQELLNECGIKPNETKEEYLKRKENEISYPYFSTFAVIKDGKWYEKGEMGWWGAVHNEKDQKEWDKEFANLINDLPDDTLLSVFDCHI